MHLDPIAPGSRVRLTDKAARAPRALPEGPALEDALARSLERTGGAPC
jgi:hypothetical protein